MFTLTLSPTTRGIKVGLLSARLWEGTAPDGSPVLAWVLCLGADANAVSPAVLVEMERYEAQQPPDVKRALLEAARRSIGEYLADKQAVRNGLSLLAERDRPPPR